MLAIDALCRAAFGSTLVGFDFVLDDLAQQTDAQILGRASEAIVRLTLLALRNGRLRPRLFVLVASAMAALRNELRGPTVGSALALLARYSFELDEAPPAVIQAAFDAALVPEHRSEVMVTAADVLRAEGRREALLDQLEVKFGQVEPAVRARVEQASNEQVIAWLRRVVVVSTLGDVFKG